MLIIFKAIKWTFPLGGQVNPNLHYTTYKHFHPEFKKKSYMKKKKEKGFSNKILFNDCLPAKIDIYSLEVVYLT